MTWEKKATAEQINSTRGCYTLEPEANLPRKNTLFPGLLFAAVLFFTFRIKEGARVTLPGLL